MTHEDSNILYNEFIIDRFTEKYSDMCPKEKSNINPGAFEILNHE